MRQPARASREWPSFALNYLKVATTLALLVLISREQPEESAEATHVNSSESLASAWFYQQDQPAILSQCCACDEAKYELVFEGLWSKYTHPDDFPENYWLAHFSDIIGASHSNDFQMWSKGALASDGVRELAELGSTKKLESELKQVSTKTRTIIKARELRYPTLNSKTSAVFRTDKLHHLVSILSKLGPSPDWMVGVSSLELCQVDCNWAAQRVMNLYLWDAGTDSGATFTASDQPTQPQARIQPYQSQAKVSAAAELSSWPDSSNNNSNNYYASQMFGGGGEKVAQPNPSGVDIGYRPSSGPNRRNYAESMLPPVVEDLESGSQEQSKQGPSSMAGNELKPFARLTVTRQRIYEKSCNGAAGPSMIASRLNGSIQQHHHYPNHLQPSINIPSQDSGQTYSDCRYTEWSYWSACSSTCGKGIRTRTRSFLDDRAHLAGCQQSDLIEKEICLAECRANVSCVTRDWSEWSRCSVDCGQGMRKRTRALINNGRQDPSCMTIPLAELEMCVGDCDTAETHSTDETYPGGAESSQCAVTEWSQWSECSVACGKGTKIRTRQFVRRNSAENCSSVKLLQKQSCNGRPELCKQVANNKSPNNQRRSHEQQQQQQNQKFNYDLPVIDCQLSGWGPWSTCSALCGHGRRTRSRFIIQMPQNGGRPCDKKLTRTQKCRDLPPCPQGFQIRQNLNDGEDGSDKLAKSNQSAAAPAADVSKQPQRGPALHRTTSTTSTSPSSIMDDEDDSKFSRSLKSDLEQLRLLSWLPTVGYVSDELATSTEMELLGSSNFHIRNGFVYPP